MKDSHSKKLPPKSSPDNSGGRLRQIPRWEECLLDILEKHMLLLAVLLVSLLALYLRKVAVWWNYAEILAYFDHHANHTETTFYYLLLKIAEYIPILPLHSFKWLGGLSDFLLAILCSRIAGGGNRLKQSILYMLCLYSPVVFLRGIIWAQPDSAALTLLLAACLLLQNNENKNHASQAVPKAKKAAIRDSVPAILCAGVSIALSPCLFLLFLLILYVPSVSGFDTASAGASQSPANATPSTSSRFTDTDETDETILPNRLSPYPLLTGAAALITAMLLQIISAFFLKTAPAESLYSLFRFGTYHPLTGALYETPGGWLVQMLMLYGLPISVLSFLYAGKTKKKCAIFFATLFQVITVLLYSDCLFYN